MCGGGGGFWSAYPANPTGRGCDHADPSQPPQVDPGGGSEREAPVGGDQGAVETHVGVASARRAPRRGGHSSCAATGSSPGRNSPTVPPELPSGVRDTIHQALTCENRLKKAQWRAHVAEWAPASLGSPAEGEDTRHDGPKRWCFALSCCGFPR